MVSYLSLISDKINSFFDISKMKNTFLVLQMEPLLKKLSQEITAGTLVVTCRYQFPVKHDRALGEGIDAVWLYNSETIRQQTSKKNLISWHFFCFR